MPRISRPRAVAPDDKRPASTGAAKVPARRSDSRTGSAVPVAARCEQALAALRQHANATLRDGMTRYGIPNDKAIGVSMRDIQAVAKRFGRDHELAAALWQTDLYDARMLACYVDDPACVTPEQMESWARDFDNWAHCDTACFALFDRTPHAWDKVDAWSARSEEFVRRGAFALLASLTVHDKKAPDANYLHGLTLIERAASDERNCVKKAVNWALRSIGKRNPALHAAAIDVARRLAAATAAAPRWVGKDALRELSGAAVMARIAARHGKSG